MIFDKAELRLIAEHIASLFQPGRHPTMPATYGTLEVGDLNDWELPTVDLLVEEGRRTLDAINGRFENLRNRSQYLVGVLLGTITAAVGMLDLIIEGPAAFLVWALGITSFGLALIIAFAAFAATAELGSVDPVLFSREKPDNHLDAARSLARAYTKAVMRTTTALHVRFTLYRDAAWFFVVGVVFIAAAWGLGHAAR